LKQLEVATMARFLITYHGGEIPRDPEFVPGGSATRSSAAFVTWFRESGSSVVDWGGSVRPAATVSGEGTKDGLAAGPLNAWTVIEAPDADAAAGLLQNHPFIILRGGMLQIWEPRLVVLTGRP
jgi:hypothetical protein